MEERLRSNMSSRWLAHPEQLAVEAVPSGGGTGDWRPTPGEDGNDDLFDWGLIFGWTAFAVSAPRRHKAVAVSVLVSALCVTTALVAALPRTYHTEATILASRNLVMPALGNPGRAIPMDADAPTRAAAENILRRDNILALIEQTDLMKQWDVSRAPLAKVRDYIVSKVRGPLDEDEKRDALAYTLEHRLKVTAGDGTLKIEIDWPDARMAFRLVALAQQNFLESRHAMEVSTIAEAISILEGHAAAARDRIDAAMQELKAQHGARPVSALPQPLSRQPSARETADAEELANIRLMLVAKRRALQDLEEYRRRRLSDLQSQLAEQLSTYTLAHPLVIATRESIESLQKESPQLATLRREEQDLLRQYVARAGRNPESDGNRPASADLPHLRMPARLAEPRTESAAGADAGLYWRTQLDFAIQKYEDLVDRIEAARIELDTARAAFKYRYAVYRPAEVPKKPSKPKVALLLLGGGAIGALLALLVTTAADVRRGLLLQPWQIERQLQVPILARMDRQ